jgi:hypothetical protein
MNYLILIIINMEKSKEESKKPPGGSGPGTPSSQMSFTLNDNIDQLNAD